MEQSVLEALGRSGVHQDTLDAVIIPHLLDLGVRQLVDLPHVTRKDVSDIVGQSVTVPRTV